MQDEATGGPQRVKVQTLMQEMGLARGTGAAGASDAMLAGLGALGGVEKAVMQVSLSVGKSLGESLGMKNSTDLSQILPCPYETALRAMLAAMAAGPSGLVAAFDTARGAYLEGVVPRSILVMGGTLVFDVIDSGGPTTQVNGTCDIPGQKFAYGTGKKSLTAVFDRATTMMRRF